MTVTCAINAVVCPVSVLPPRHKRSVVLVALSWAFLLASWRTFAQKESQQVVFTTDSAEIGVRLWHYQYSANIAFTYVNATSKALSQVGTCFGLMLPQLEKKIDQNWVVAYYPIYPSPSVGVANLC